MRIQINKEDYTQEIYEKFKKVFEEEMAKMQ